MSNEGRLLHTGQNVAERLADRVNISVTGENNLALLGGVPAVLTMFPHVGHSDWKLLQEAIEKVDPERAKKIIIPAKRGYWFSDNDNLRTKIFSALPQLFIPDCIVMPLEEDEPNQRAADLEAIREYALATGSSVLLSPEGTRTNNKFRDRKIKGGFAELALALGLPIVPIGMAGADKVMKRGDWYPHVFLHKQNVSVSFGEPIDPAQFTSQKQVQNRRNIKQALIDSYKNMSADLWPNAQW